MAPTASARCSGAARFRGFRERLPPTRAIRARLAPARVPRRRGERGGSRASRRHRRRALLDPRAAPLPWCGRYFECLRTCLARRRACVVPPHPPIVKHRRSHPHRPRLPPTACRRRGWRCSTAGTFLKTCARRLPASGAARRPSRRTSARGCCRRRGGWRDALAPRGRCAQVRRRWQPERRGRGSTATASSRHPLRTGRARRAGIKSQPQKARDAFFAELTARVERPRFT